MRLAIALFASIVLAGCASTSSTKQALLGPVPLYPAPVDMTDFNAADHAAKTDRTKAPPRYATQREIAEVWNEGTAAGFRQCTAWFRLVSNQATLGNYSLQQFNVLNSALTAALALTITHPATAAVAAGADAIVGGIGNGLADVNMRALLAPSVFQIQDKVLTAMADMAEKVAPSLPQMSYAMVQIKLEQYQALCQPPAIQAMVNKSLDLSEPETDHNGRVRMLPAGNRK